MAPDQTHSRLGLNVPYEWWPAAALVKSFEAAGFGWTQVPAPPAAILADPRQCALHAGATGAALAATGLRSVVHGPGALRVGDGYADRIFEGLLAYAAEAGAEQVIYHARNFEDSPASEDALLAETRSLARLAASAERLGVAIAIENLAPLFPAPERLGHIPMTLRALVQRISSPAVGICLDVGHAHVAADVRHTDVGELVRPVLDAVICFHLHDNLGARREGDPPPELDPMRLDLHLPPGRGSVPWSDLAPSLRDHGAPLLLEIHPPHRPEPGALFEGTAALLFDQRTAPVPAR